MNEEELQEWVDEQIEALVAAGVDPLDAQNTMNEVLAELPSGVDPRTWIPPADMGPVEITEADIEDARADWYRRSPSRFARLLDASEENGAENST